MLKNKQYRTTEYSIYKDRKEFDRRANKLGDDINKLRSNLLKFMENGLSGFNGINSINGIRQCSLKYS